MYLKEMIEIHNDNNNDKQRYYHSLILYFLIDFHIFHNIFDSQKYLEWYSVFYNICHP